MNRLTDCHSIRITQQRREVQSVNDLKMLKIVL